MASAFYGRGKEKVGQSTWVQGNSDFLFVVFQTWSEISAIPGTLLGGPGGKVCFTVALGCLSSAFLTLSDACSGLVRDFVTHGAITD